MNIIEEKYLHIYNKYVNIYDKYICVLFIKNGKYLLLTSERIPEIIKENNGNNEKEYYTLVFDTSIIAQMIPFILTKKYSVIIIDSALNNNVIAIHHPQNKYNSRNFCFLPY